MKIAFNKIYYTGKEKEYIDDALVRRELSGDGFYTERVTELMQKKFNLSKLLTTTSGTHALEMATELIDLNDEDEVIMPSFTFSSTANSVLQKGANVVFAEIKNNTFNLDPDKLEKYINKKTKAIIPVHYSGISCDMDKINEIAKKYNLYVIEDAAHAVNAKYKDKFLGSIGDFACYSFHGSKNYVCGEGGALVINNEKFEERAEVIREKGTNRHKFLKGEVDKYTWVDKGSSYLPSEILMALLYAQLEELDKIRKMRENIYNFYYKSLKKYENSEFLDYVAKVPVNRTSNYHIFYLKFSTKKNRDFVLEKLKTRGIQATFHYIPLHSSPMGKRLGYKRGDLKITEEVAATILRLPLYPELKKNELDYIIKNIEDIFSLL